jgi:hypothetical protein
MDITTLTSADFRKITKLLEAKERLLAQVEIINHELQSFERNGKGKRPLVSKPAASKGKRSKRGKTKELVIAELKSAGKAGVHVKELAERLGVKTANLTVWFFSTGKKIKEIKKVAPATYAWNE